MQVIEAQCASILEPHDHLHISQIRTFWRAVGAHNYASSRAIGADIAVLIVTPDLCSGQGEMS
jgi:hypothetical protein